MSEDKDFKLKWGEFKLDTSKYKRFEIKEFNSEEEKEQMKVISDFKKARDKLMKEKIKQVAKEKERITIEAIVDIYNQKYPNYKVYVEITKALIMKVRELNNKPFTNDMINEIYIEPPILSRNAFNTAYKLGKKRGK